MEEAIIAKLLATSQVTALVSQRIQPGRRPQATLLPAIVVNRIAGAPVYTDDGESGLASARIEVDCWALSYASAKLTARAVIDALSAFFGTVGAHTFQNVLLDAERDFNESGTGETQYLYRTNLDFIVWFEN